MPSEALEELDGLASVDKESRKAQELKLAAQMLMEDWQAASETARELCRLASGEADFFLSAAYCLHECGETEEAKKWLMSGPEELHEIPVYHYNMACYLWMLGEPERARNHLAKAVEMDENFLDVAKLDRDLVGMNF